MGKFTKIPASTFDTLQLEAGMVLNHFDPTNPVEPADNEIICATTGGIQVTYTPTYSDMGEDVDNCPVNMMELKHLDSVECGMSFTALDVSPQVIRLSLGAADVNASIGKITPRRDLLLTDFGDVWWVGDKANGGMVAIRLKNALSTDGFSLQTTKNGKGQVSVGLTGHVSINAQDVMPMEFYSTDAEDAPTYVYTAVTPVGTENPSEEGWYVLVGDSYRMTSDTTVDTNKTYYERTEA